MKFLDTADRHDAAGCVDKRGAKVDVLLAVAAIEAEETHAGIDDLPHTDTHAVAVLAEDNHSLGAGNDGVDDETIAVRHNRNGTNHDDSVDYIIVCQQRDVVVAATVQRVVATLDQQRVIAAEAV